MNRPFQPDETDLALLNALQDDLSLTARPWREIGERLGISEEETIRRIKELTAAGIIRGISPVLESRPLGLHAATLVAFRVPEERIEKVAAIVSRYLEVSHNFLREHEYNLWFTIAAPDNDRIGRVQEEIMQKAGILPADILNLPTIKKIKIDVRFPFVAAQHKEHTFGPD